MGDTYQEQNVMQSNAKGCIDTSDTYKLNIHPTGIRELDEVLNGGLPEGHTVLLSGTAGTGKTVLAMQWLFTGLQRYEEQGVYITLTESIDKAIRVGNNMEFFERDFIGPGGIFFTDLRMLIQELDFDPDNVDQGSIDMLIEHIRHFVELSQAKRLVIDSVTAIGFVIKSRELMRYAISKLGAELAKLDCTSLLISEASHPNHGIYGVEEFISDGLIKLKYQVGEQQMIRTLNILKMRGLAYRSGAVTYDITTDGFQIYPKIPIDRSTAKTSFDIRFSSGLDALDDMTGGGYPEGHMILIAGNTGTGKSTFGMHFLKKGIELNQPCIYVALEESAQQICKTAEAHGWDFETPHKQEKLCFINPSLLDVYPDKLLYQMKNTADRIGAKRVVIDSISSLESATMTKKKLREFMLQFADYFKANGITCLMTYLTESMFGAEKGVLLAAGSSSELRLSSIVDGVIILRYFEFKQSVTKLINVLKLRGSKHNKDIREFIVEKEGIRISTTQFKP